MDAREARQTSADILKRATPDVYGTGSWIVAEALAAGKNEDVLAYLVEVMSDQVYRAMPEGHLEIKRFPSVNLNELKRQKLRAGFKVMIFAGLSFPKEALKGKVFENGKVVE